MVYTNWIKLENCKINVFFNLVSYCCIICFKRHVPWGHETCITPTKWEPNGMRQPGCYMMCQQPLIWCVVQFHLLYLWFAKIDAIWNPVRHYDMSVTGTAGQREDTVQLSLWYCQLYPKYSQQTPCSSPLWVNYMVSTLSQTIYCS